MEGAQLSVNMLVVHGVRSRLNNGVRVARGAQVGVQDVACSGLCSALAVSTAEQKKSGVVVVDLGAGTTDYVAYAGGVVSAMGVLGVGGDHATNDIAIGFGIPTAQAEQLKREAGSVDPRAVSAAPVVTLPPEGGFPGRTLSVPALNTIMHARMDELLNLIRRRLDREDVLHHLGAGIVLTGGGARTAGLLPLAEAIFGLPCSIGRPRHVSGLVTATSGPEYATAAGLVQYGFKTARESARPLALPAWLSRLIWRQP
jgi:cell division protein FtsA